MLDKKSLEEIILNINYRTGIRNEILEKDYYVCLVLKDLSNKQEKLQAYFKGGTAVYKILDQMNRFSEDIDLTVKNDKTKSKTFNTNRIKKSALDYNIQGLELIKEESIVNIGSITSFYRYNSLFNMNELFKSEKIQIEATSFTVSEPVSKYTIEPLIYKYATDEEKKILKDKYSISEFEMEIIKLERIFVDKIFAAEFYYERNMLDDVSKHLYDISIMMNNLDIKRLLNNDKELIKMIEYKRTEELFRKGGIPENKKIIDFNYMKLDFSNELISSFNRMQKIYVLDDKYLLTIDEVKEKIKLLNEIFENLYKLKDSI